MPHARDSSVQEIVMEEAPVVQETRTSEKAPITKNVFGLKKTSITNKPTVLRRSSRIVPHAASKITKSYAKETSDRAKPLDKAAQLKKILRSKTNESKIEKPGLTLEEIEEDMIAMGITTASSSKTQAHPSTNLKSFMQQSSSHITPVASTSRQKLPGTTNDEHQGKSLQPVHTVAGTAIQLPTSAAREDPQDDYTFEEQLFLLMAARIRARGLRS